MGSVIETSPHEAPNVIPQPESSGLSCDFHPWRSCWATAQPTSAGIRRLGRGPTPTRRQVRTFRLWYNMAIALTRIAEEAERRMGTLDLSNLRLEALPKELFDLRHLRVLDLGN